MYCPYCLNNTLFLDSRGVVDVIINGKHMDAGRFNFRLGAEYKEKMRKDFRAKMEEFFQWYSKFENIMPIQLVQLVTSNAQCDHRCSFAPGTKFSIVDELIPADEIQVLLNHLGAKYHMEIKLKDPN